MQPGVCHLRINTSFLFTFLEGRHSDIRSLIRYHGKWVFVFTYRPHNANKHSSGFLHVVNKSYQFPTFFTLIKHVTLAYWTLTVPRLR